MDRTSSSTCRTAMTVQTPPQTPQTPAAAPRTAIPAQDVAPPPAPPAKGAPSCVAGLDAGRAASAACVSAVAIGGLYGGMSAINSAVRATPGLPKAVKVAAALLPSLSVYATPWVEDRVRLALGTAPTYPLRPSLAHDAVASAGLFLFNAWCSRSARVPKFPPATPAAMATAVVQCTLASAIAGGASELSAQWMNARDRAAGVTTGAPVFSDNHRKGMGRLYSQLPAAALHVHMARRGKPLPAHLAQLPGAVVSGGWACRRVLMPPASPSTPVAPLPQPDASRPVPAPDWHSFPSV